MNEQWKARRDRAGGHCQQVHQALVPQGQLDAQHVQVDEIRVKGRGMIVWMGMALMVSTRLWLGGECPSGSQLGRSVVATGASLLPTVASSSRVYRWMGCVPRQHPAGVSGKSQTHCRTGASMFAGVAWALYRDRHQAHREETGRGSPTENDTGDAGTSEHPVTSLIRRQRAQYGLY